MKIALFSDIHANLPAFQAFLADLDSRKPDTVYCLGDLVGYNVWPNEIINEIRRRGIATLAGNHDLKVLDLPQVTSEQLEFTGKDYSYHIIDPENRKYLLGLPSHIKLEYQSNGQAFNILMVHGSPRSVNEYVLQDTDEAHVLELMEEAATDLMFVGHSHKPYHRRIGVNKKAVNIGSVGKPKDGNPQGCYVLLTFDTEDSIYCKRNIQIDFIRFDYDVEAAAKAIEKSPLPDEYASQFRYAY